MSRTNERVPSDQQGRILTCVSREIECALFYYSCLFGLCGVGGTGVEMCCPDPLPKECANFMLFGLLADLAVLTTNNITFIKNTATCINKQPTAETETEPLQFNPLPETGRLLTCASRRTENNILYYCCLTGIFGGLMVGTTACCSSLPISTAAYYCLLSGCDAACATCITTNIKPFSKWATIWKSSASTQDPRTNSVHNDTENALPPRPAPPIPITRAPIIQQPAQQPPSYSRTPSNRYAIQAEERAALLGPPPPYSARNLTGAPSY